MERMRPLPPTPFGAATYFLRLSDHPMHSLQQLSDGEWPAKLPVDRDQDELGRLPLGRHEHDHLEVLEGRVLSDLLQDAPPVLVGQFGVEDQEVVPPGLQSAEPGSAAGGLVHEVARELEAQDRLPDMLGTVIDEQDPLLRHGGSVSVRVPASGGKTEHAATAVLSPEHVLTGGEAPFSLPLGCYGSPFS